MGKSNKKSSKRNTGKTETVVTTGRRALVAGLLIWLTIGFWRESGLEWIKSLAIAVGFALVIRWTLAEPFRIPSGSMLPTLYGDERMFHGDRVFVNKLVYGLRYPLNGCRIPFTHYRIEYAKKRLWRRADPQRWDIVVFKSVEPHATNTTLVKRLVGLPGERIHIANGKVHVNGSPLELPPGMPEVEYTSWGREMTCGVLTDDAYAVVPEDCYLLLGDNSRSSRDGRYFGWVHNERILGRVSCIWWPYPRWRDFTGFSRTWWWRTVVTIVGILLFVRLFLGRFWSAYVERPDGTMRVDHFYINRWAFGPPIPFTRRRLARGRNPRRGELVLYHHPTPDKEQPPILLGRVAGLPGERVFLDAGKIHIDGEPVTEPPALAETTFATVEGVGPYARSKGKEHSLVPEDHVFILTESPDPEMHYDSRTAGWIPHANLIGAATVVWWPPSRWRRVGLSS